MSDHRHRVHRTAAAVAVTALVAGVGIGVLGPAAATANAEGVERITSYHIDYQVRANGVTHVQEQIRYDFGPAEHHGVERLIRTRERRTDGKDRLYKVGNVHATSSSGAPGDVTLDSVGDESRIRIGDPSITVHGVQDYTLDYDLTGALNAFADHDELYWDAAGPDWRVPIDDLTVTVRAPGGVTRARCLAGRPGSTNGCTEQPTRAQGVATYRQAQLQPGEVVTIVAAFPRDRTQVPPPMVEAHNPVLRVFAVTPVTVGAAAVVLVLGALPFGLALRRRRDRRYVGTVPGLAPAAGSVPAEEAAPFGDTGEMAVQFSPPHDVSPGEAGILLRRHGDTADTTATLLDLAVRGYVHISEAGYGWTLSVRRGPDPGLRPHEMALLSALFSTEASIQLSTSAKKVAAAARAVTAALRRRVVERGWMRRVRARRGPSGAAFAIGCVALVMCGPFALGIGGWLTVSLHLGFVVAAAVVALGLVVASRLLGDGRTAAGHAVYVQVAGFRRYLETAEAEQLRFEEGEDIFGRYLPWATVFGITKRWAQVCERLAVEGRIPPSVGWYQGSDPWSYDRFPDRMTSLSTTLTAAAAPQSSWSGSGGSASGSSGFSSSSSAGGGGGGGGGGSW